MEKTELNYKGYVVVLQEGEELNNNMIDLLSSIEDYSFSKQRALKIVFFNYDAKNNEAGVSFFYRREKD